MSHHEEEGSRHGYDAELVAEEICRHMANWINRNLQGEKVTPTREQIAETLSRFVYNYKLDVLKDIADALLREYEIRERDELPKL